MADFCSAFMVFFNVIALFGLSKYVNFALKDYQFQKARRMETPLWNYDLDITEQYLNSKKRWKQCLQRRNRLLIYEEYENSIS